MMCSAASGRSNGRREGGRGARASPAGGGGPAAAARAPRGGASSRLVPSGGWAGAAASGELNASAYVIRSKLNLYSNFTYFLEDPVNGDQFRQVDDRSVAGFELGELWNIGRLSLRLGVQGRFDDIGRVGLYRTREREPVSTVREDSVRQGSLGTYAHLELAIGGRRRSTS